MKHSIKKQQAKDFFVKYSNAEIDEDKKLVKNLILGEKKFEKGTTTEEIMKYIIKKARRADLGIDDLIKHLEEQKTTIEKEIKGKYVNVLICTDGLKRKAIVVNPTNELLKLDERACYVLEEIFGTMYFTKQTITQDVVLCTKKDIEENIAVYWKKELNTDRLLITNEYTLSYFPKKCIRPVHLYEAQEEDIIQKLYKGYGVVFKKLF